MKITVLNGSPKGNNSVTMSYIKYLQAQYPEHDFNIITVALSVPRLEKDTAAFQQVINEIDESDAIIWAFPLYFMLVHSHYKRFIELIWERKAEEKSRECVSRQICDILFHFNPFLRPHCAQLYSCHLR